MNGKSIKILTGAAVALAAAGAIAATVLPSKSANVARVDDESLSVASLGDVNRTESESEGAESSAVEQNYRTSRGPAIPASLREHAEFIQNRWVEGPYLSEIYVPIMISCGHDCRALIIGDTVTGDIVETGMGFADMNGLEVDSRGDSDLLLMMWENLQSGNCNRAIYRWNGQSLAAVSDITAYAFTDAGCGQFQLAHVEHELD